MLIPVVISRGNLNELSLCPVVFPQIRTSTVRVQEGGVHLALTVVDTPGFGDVVDNSQW